MLARFFIDRPIFAWVLSLVIILIGGVAVFFLPIDLYPPITPPTVQVTATYPGANAEVVAKIIAAPIEQQVNGVENMLYMSSQSTNDGNYTLDRHLRDRHRPQHRPGAGAEPRRPGPAAIARPGAAPGRQHQEDLAQHPVRHQPDLARRPLRRLYLSNFATIQLQDELLRIKGVGDIKILGIGNYSMRLWLDPDKLATRSLTAVDVVNAISNQNVQVAAGQVGQQPVPAGQQFQLTMSALGRLESPEAVRRHHSQDRRAERPSPRNGHRRRQSTGYRRRGASRRSRHEQRRRPGRPRPRRGPRRAGGAELRRHLQPRRQPSAIMAVFQLPGSNALERGEAVKAKMEELKAGFLRASNTASSTTPRRSSANRSTRFLPRC